MKSLKILTLSVALLTATSVFAANDALVAEGRVKNDGWLGRSYNDFKLVESNGKETYLNFDCNGQPWHSQAQSKVIFSKVRTAMEFGKPIKILGNKYSSDRGEVACVADVQIIF